MQYIKHLRLRHAHSILGKDAYNHFIICAGYTHYEKEDAYDTLYNYEFNDNYAEDTGLSISWKRLVDELIKQVNVYRTVS